MPSRKKPYKSDMPADTRTLRLLKLFTEQAKEHAIICMDPQGVVVAWLGAAEEILGYSATDAIGKDLAQIFTPEDRAKGFDKYELEVAAQDSRSEDDRWHLRMDGTRIWASGTVNAIHDRDGTLLGFVKIMRDRTDVQTRLETLEAQAAALRESRERTHMFLRTLGHELRNPLGPVSNAAQIIGRLNTDPLITGALQIISRQVAVLTRLADDLMDISRLERGKLELSLRRSDLHSLLRDAAQSVGKAAAAKNLRLETILPEAPLFVNIDEDRFQQVVLNLLGNAIKYTPEGGSIWVKTAQEGNEIVVKVQDTGIGIAPDMVPRIFELFTQAPVATDMVPGGLGVGLAVVRQIVELHGGSVQARSAGAGKGSEFTVRIPAPPQRTKLRPRTVAQGRSASSQSRPAPPA
jgi:PAS domain S-box-containing protein